MIAARARRILAAGRVAHVAVDTRGGPHVTPQAFAVTHDHLWLVAARSALKVRVLMRRPQIGVLVRDGDRSAVISGTAEVLWPSSPEAAARAAAVLPALPWVAGAYGTRNAGLLAGYAADVVGSSAPLPADRVLMMVTASRGLIVDGDDVVDVWGSWSSGGDPGGDMWIDVPSLPESLPDAVRELGQEQRVAVAGCETPDGPVALPATWESATGRAHVPAGALAVVGAAVPGRACVTLDRSTGMRPSQFAGVMLRGRLTPVGDRLRKLIVERATWWDGFGTGTVDAA